MADEYEADRAARLAAWAALDPDQKEYLNRTYTDRMYEARAEVAHCDGAALVRRLQSAKRPRCQCAELAGLLDRAGTVITQLMARVCELEHINKQHEAYQRNIRGALKPVV